MASWTNPLTWNVGDKVTAALLNAHLRDNSLYLYSPPQALVQRMANLSISPSGTAVAVTWDAYLHNPNSLWSAGAATRITVTEAGLYLINAYLDWAANSTGIRQGYIRKGGSTVLANHLTPAVTGGGTTSFTVSVLTQLSASNYIELVANQTSGGALNLQALSSLSVCKVG